MSSPAGDEALEFSAGSSRPARGLRAKLMQLSMILTALGVALLVVSSITVLWLRSNANQLALRRTPAAVATQRAQIGLQRSLAGLRGWVALGDEGFRSERATAWKEQIEPAIAAIRSYEGTWNDPADRARLTQLADLLVELKESQWWVEDVARTDGNQPALQIRRGRVEPIAVELRRVIDGLIAETGATPSRRARAALQAMMGFRDALGRAQHALARFVVEGEERWSRDFSQALSEAEASVQWIAAEPGRHALSKSDRVGYLARELPWYAQFAREALDARSSASWNVALYRMSTETIPLTRRTTELLDVLAASQGALMGRDTRLITFAGNTAMMSSVVLIVLMAAIAYALASYRAGQITRPISALSRATVELADGRLKRNLPVTTEDELGTLTDAFNRMRVRLQESEAALVKSNEQLHDANQDLERHNRFVRDTFGRYLSDDIVANLLDTPEGLALGGENREVTILMSDLRGFTSLAARLEPEQVVSLLNCYFGVMVDVITRHDGTIDEFIGDAVLVIFGAPIAREDHARAAVACAVEMQLAMGLVNEQNRGVGLPEVEMGIGINTGQVVVGNIGSDTRAKYGVVGSPVNLTSRIESYTVGGQILISEATQRAAGPILTLGDTLEIEAKGVDAPMTICEVLGIGGAYDLQLIEDAENLVTLAAPIPLEYVIVEGKHLDATLHHGTLVKLSSAGGEVLSEHVVAARSNIRVQLRPVGGPPVAGELYAKVMAPLPDGPAGFSIRFTSIPPEVTAMFARWIA